MKKINVLITIAFLFFFSGCTKYEFYDWAIISKRDVSNLELKKIQINDGEIVYLEIDSKKKMRHSFLSMDLVLVKIIG